MSDELKIAALSLLLDDANQKPLPQVMQDVSLEWLAERDQTPVDDEWLNNVLGHKKVDSYDGRSFWWISDIGLICVVRRNHSQFELQTDFDDALGRTPTRGDVLTALRLFGGGVMSEINKGSNMKMYIVCCGTNGRAVLIGESPVEPEAGKPITLNNARMVLYWDAKCGGLLGLAASGPKGNTRITASVERHGDECVRQWVAVSDSARTEIDAWKAC